MNEQHTDHINPEKETEISDSCTTLVPDGKKAVVSARTNYSEELSGTEESSAQLPEHDRGIFRRFFERFLDFSRRFSGWFCDLSDCPEEQEPEDSFDSEDPLDFSHSRGYVPPSHAGTDSSFSPSHSHGKTHFANFSACRGHSQPPHADSSPSRKEKRRRIFRRVLLSAGIAMLALVVLSGISAAYLIAAAPDIDALTVSPSESATYIYDQDGNILRKLTLSSSNREIVSLDEIPESLQNAIVAIEDERFFEHGGIDLRGIARAFLNGLAKGRFSEGASTITQQLIKNSVFTEWTQENSFLDRLSRKIQEQYLAIRLEKQMSKEEILEDYLNIINFGSGCCGAQAASRRYFGKPASELTLSESTVLAAIPQNPTAMNPINFPENNNRRRMVVLNYMEEQGYITAEQHEKALTDNVYDRIREYDAGYEDNSVYTYYEDALIDQVIDLLTGEKGYSYDQAYHAVYSGGLRITSAQDQRIQDICDQEFANEQNFPAGTLYGVDYALSIADADGIVTHYGQEHLRKYVRENLDASFNLMCQDTETVQNYADAFREAMLASCQKTDSADSGNSGSSDNGGSPEDSGTNNDSSDSNGSSGDSGANNDSSSGSGNTEDSGANNDSSSGSGSPEDSDANNDDSSGSDSGGSSEDSGTNVPQILAERLTFSPQPQASVVVIDQTTGFVRAVVGGRGEKTASLTLNRATDTTRQPGSTFKILTAYAPALDVCGKTLASEYENQPCEYQDGTPVSNWDLNDYSGPTSIRDAIARSINVVAVRCITEITPQLGFQYAQKFGISTLHETYESGGNYSSDIVQPLALGGITQGVSNLELCSAYAAIANEGIYHTPKFFTKITDRHGNVIADYTALSDTSGDNAGDKNKADNKNSSKNSHKNKTDEESDGIEVIKPSTAWLLTDAMKDVVSSESGTAYGLISAGAMPVAGKTGTTSSYKDIWFAGYTPYYTCCVWGGYDNNDSLPDSSTYHTYNKTLWSSIMTRIHASLPPKDFACPDDIIAVNLCSESGLPAVKDGCMDIHQEFFEKGTEPSGKCPLHKPVPETEKHVIYQDILDELFSKTGKTKVPDDTEISPVNPGTPGTTKSLDSSETSSANPGTSDTTKTPDSSETSPTVPGTSGTTKTPNSSETSSADPGTSGTTKTPDSSKTSPTDPRTSGTDKTLNGSETSSADSGAPGTDKILDSSETSSANPGTSDTTKTPDSSETSSANPEVPENAGTSGSSGTPSNFDNNSSDATGIPGSSESESPDGSGSPNSSSSSGQPQTTSLEDMIDQLTRYSLP